MKPHSVYSGGDWIRPCLGELGCYEIQLDCCIIPEMRTEPVISPDAYTIFT
jgi:hypothetical protein